MPNCEGWVRSQDGNPSDSIAALTKTSPTCTDSIGAACTVDVVDYWDTPTDPYSQGWPADSQTVHVEMGGKNPAGPTGRAVARSLRTRRTSFGRGATSPRRRGELERSCLLDVPERRLGEPPVRLPRTDQQPGHQQPDPLQRPEADQLRSRLFLARRQRNGAPAVHLRPARELRARGVPELRDGVLDPDGVPLDVPGRAERPPRERGDVPRMELEHEQEPQPDLRRRLLVRLVQHRQHGRPRTRSTPCSRARPSTAWPPAPARSPGSSRR